MSNKSTRLITLIMLLQRKPNQKASALAKELGISVRSLHRYFNQLEEMGIPVYAERGPHGGFSLVRGYKMPPLVFTPEEAVAVYLGTNLVETIWGNLYAEDAQGALAKLDNVLPDEQLNEIEWAQRSLVTTATNQINHEEVAERLEKLRRAIREHRTVTCIYHTAGEASSETRTIHPYTLLHRWGWWYVVAYCTLREDMRAFRIDRMHKLTLNDSTFNKADDFDIQAYLENEFNNQPLYTIRLRFAPQLESIAHEYRAMWQSREKDSDGKTIVSYQAPDLTWPTRQIISFGPGVEVLEPVQLRQNIAEWALRIYENYNK